MSDPYLGQIMQVGWDYANTGWAQCNGALIAISQNSALFALLGTAFGGDGRSTFGLPDAQGRVLVGVGHGAGLQTYLRGQKLGTETNTLTIPNLPAHNHPAAFSQTGNTLQPNVTINGTAASGTTSTPTATDNYLSSPPNVSGASQARIYGPAPATPTALAGVSMSGAIAGNVTVGITGSNVPVNNIQPSLAVWTLIAMQGIFPSRG